MNAVLTIENIIDAFNYNFKSMYPDANGNFIVKRNIEKGIFGAVKTFLVNVYFVQHKRGFIPEPFLNCKLTITTTTPLEEERAWKELGIMLTAKLFSFINYIHLDSYGYRS